MICVKKWTVIGATVHWRLIRNGLCWKYCCQEVIINRNCKKSCTAEVCHVIQEPDWKSVVTGVSAALCKRLEALSWFAFQLAVIGTLSNLMGLWLQTNTVKIDLIFKQYHLENVWLTTHSLFHMTRISKTRQKTYVDDRKRTVKFMSYGLASLEFRPQCYWSSEGFILKESKTKGHQDRNKHWSFSWLLV